MKQSFSSLYEFEMNTEWNNQIVRFIGCNLGFPGLLLHLVFLLVQWNLLADKASNVTECIRGFSLTGTFLFATSAGLQMTSRTSNPLWFLRFISPADVPYGQSESHKLFTGEIILKDIPYRLILCWLSFSTEK